MRWIVKVAEPAEPRLVITAFASVAKDKERGDEAIGLPTHFEGVETIRGRRGLDVGEPPKHDGCQGKRQSGDDVDEGLIVLRLLVVVQSFVGETQAAFQETVRQGRGVIGTQEHRKPKKRRWGADEKRQ